MAITLDQLRREREAKEPEQSASRADKPITIRDIAGDQQPLASPAGGLAKDVALSAAIGIPRGVLDLVGLPANLTALGNAGGRWLADKAGLVNPDAANPVDTFMAPGLGRIAPVRALRAALPMLTSGNMESAAESVTGKWYDPQTGAGKVVEQGVRGAVSAPGARVTAATAAASGEVGAQLYGEGARLPAALFGGALPGLYQTMRGTPGQIASDALLNVSGKQLRDAQALMDRARLAGAPITAAEAIAQVTGKNSLQDVQRVVEQSGKGGPIMQPMMNARPDAGRAFFNSTLDQIGPAPAAPSQTPVAMQEAAKGAITQARQAGNAAATPSYNAAYQQSVPGRTVVALTQDPVLDIALKNVMRDPKWGVKGMSPDSLQVWDAAKRWLDAQIQKSAQVPAEARIWEGARRTLTTQLDAVSPDYAQARAIVANNRQTVVNPMQASPVGDIARTAGQTAENAMAAQRQILMPPAPSALDPNTIRYTAGLLNQQSPTTLRDFTRQGLLSQYDEATQGLVSGPNQWGGAKFAAQVAGNPSQKANLQALVESAGGQRAWEGFNNFLQVMEAQGKRNAPGSLTAFNEQLKKGLAQEGAGGVLATAASPSRAMSIAKDWYDAYRYGKNTADIARILTDPKGVEILRELAITAPTSARAGVLVGALTEIGRATQDEAAPQSSR